MNKKQLFNLLELDKKIQKQSDKLLPEIYKKAKEIFDFRKMGNRWCSFPKDYGILDNECNCCGDDRIFINKKAITIHWSIYQCSEDEHFDISFPFDYLFMPNKEWQQLEIIEKQKAEEQYKKQKKQQEKERNETRQKEEMKEYKRLKKKLGI